MIGITHEQVEPSAVWTVKHNLWTRTPVLDTMILVDGRLTKVMPNKVVAEDPDTVELHWSYPVAGRVRIV